MNACYQQNFSRQLETMVRVGTGLASENCDSFPCDARQLTAKAAHALRVQLKPALPVRLAGFTFDALSDPMSFVGGDYLNVFPTANDCLSVLLFDVSGHGPEAALVAARLRSLFRGQTGNNIKHVMTQVNAQLSETLPFGRFATALYGVLDPARHRFSFARAGHEPLVLIRGNHTSMLSPQGLPLGVGTTGEFAEILQVETIELEANDRLFLFTDGLTEARNRCNEEFGLDRVLGELRTSDGNDVAALASALAEFAHNEPAHDDLTMLSIRVSN